MKFRFKLADWLVKDWTLLLHRAAGCSNSAPDYPAEGFIEEVASRHPQKTRGLELAGASGCPSLVGANATTRSSLLVRGAIDGGDI